MDLGLTFMMPQAMLQEDIWSFHKPFAPELWAALLLVLVITASALTLCSTFSPYGYAGGYTQRQDPTNTAGEEYKNSFVFANSLWYCFGSIMHQVVHILLTHLFIALCFCRYKCPFHFIQ